MKLLGVVDLELLFVYYPRKFQACMPFPVVFINLQMHKIRCMKYAHACSQIQPHIMFWSNALVVEEHTHRK